MAGSLFFPCCLWINRDEDGEVYTKTEPPAGPEISGAVGEERGAKDAEHLGSEEEQNSVRQGGGDNTGLVEEQQDSVRQGGGDNTGMVEEEQDSVRQAGGDNTGMVEEEQDSVRQGGGDNTGMVEDTNTTQTFHQHGVSGDTCEEKAEENRPTNETDKDEHEDELNQDYKRKKELDEHDESKDPSDPSMNRKSQDAWTTQECDENEDPSREGEQRDTGPTQDWGKIDPSFERDQRGTTPGSDQLCSVDDTVSSRDQLKQGIDQHCGSNDLLINKELQGTPPGSDQHDTVEETGTKIGSIASSGSERYSGGEVTVNELRPMEATDSLLENENKFKETEIKPEEGETTLQEHEIPLQENETTRQEQETPLQENETTRQEQETTPQEQETTPRETDTTQELCQQDGSEDPSEVDYSQVADTTQGLIQDPENRDPPSDREIPITIPGQEFEDQVLVGDTVTVKGPPDVEMAQEFEGNSEIQDASCDKEQQDAEAARDYVEQVLSELEHAADDVDVDVDVSETLQYPNHETQQPSPDKRLDTALHDACRLGDLQRVRGILSEGQLDINCRGRGGQTPVMTAAREEHKQVFHFLVDEGADLSLNADDGNNVLHYVCRGGQVEMVKTVLAKNMVDINSRGQGGRTPLLWAAGWGRAAIFEILAQEGADLTAVKDGGNNILHVACHGGDMVIVKYILSQDVVDLSARNHDGETAAMIAKRRGHYPVRKLLASRGCPMK